MESKFYLGDDVELFVSLKSLRSGITHIIETITNNAYEIHGFTKASPMPAP